MSTKTTMAVALSSRAKWRRRYQRVFTVLAWILVFVGADAVVAGVFLPDVKLILLGLMGALYGMRSVCE